MTFSPTMDIPDAAQSADSVSSPDGASLMPISELAPLLGPPPSRSIKAVVALIWPYSSSRRALTVLLADLDIRLRRKRGQVLVHFSGPSAKAIAKAHIQSGDEVLLSLEGGEWREEDGKVISTPGTRVEHALSFRERMVLQVSVDTRLEDFNWAREANVEHQIKHDPNDSVTLNIDHPTPSPDFRSSPASSAPSPTRHVTPLSPGPPQLQNAWPSPAFRKRKRVSPGSFVESAHDPFADRDGIGDRHGLKRTPFGRNSGGWRYADKTPSPEDKPAIEDMAEAYHDEPSPLMRHGTVEADTLINFDLEVEPIKLAAGPLGVDLEASDPILHPQLPPVETREEVVEPHMAHLDLEMASQSFATSPPTAPMTIPGSVQEPQDGHIPSQEPNLILPPPPMDEKPREVIDILSSDSSLSASLSREDSLEQRTMESKDADDTVPVTPPVMPRNQLEQAPESSPFQWTLPEQRGPANQVENLQLITPEQTQQEVQSFQPLATVTSPVQDIGDKPTKARPENLARLEAPTMPQSISLDVERTEAVDNSSEAIRLPEPVKVSKDISPLLVPLEDPGKEPSGQIMDQRPPSPTPPVPPPEESQAALDKLHALRNVSEPAASLRVGLRTAHGYFSPLASLSHCFSSIVDVFAVSVHCTDLSRSTKGPLDYFLTLHITDASIAPNSSTVQIFRPRQEALPRVQSGDVVLLRAFKVQSFKRKIGLLSSAESAWVVWQKGAGQADVKGPPVEFGDAELERVQLLKKWWDGLDARMKRDMVKEAERVPMPHKPTNGEHKRETRLRGAARMQESAVRGKEGL